LLGPASLIAAVVSLILVRAGALPPLLIFAIFVAAFAVAGCVRPTYIFFAVMALLPFEVLYVPEFPLNIQIALMLALVGLLVGFIRSPRLPSTSIGHLFLAYLAVLVLSIVQTHVFASLEPPHLLPSELGWRASPYRGWYHLVAVVMGVAVVYFVVQNVSSAPRLKASLLVLFSVSLAVSAFALYEVVAKWKNLPLVYFSFRDYDYVSKSRYFIAGMAIPRVYGSAFEPLDFGNFLLLPLSIGGALVVVGKGLRRHWFLVCAALAVAILAMVFTFSLSAWFGMLVSCAVLLIVGRSRRTYRMALPFAIGAALFLLFLPLGPKAILQSISDVQQQKIEASLGGNTKDLRYEGWRQALAVVPRFPILGVGLGNEPFWIENASLTVSSSNIFLSALVETGVLGCLLFVYLMARLVWLFCQAYRRAVEPEHRAASLGCAAALAGCLGSHMAWGSRLTSWEWFVIGLGLAVYRLFRLQMRVPVLSRLNNQVSLPRRSSPSSVSA